MGYEVVPSRHQVSSRYVQQVRLVVPVPRCARSDHQERLHVCHARNRLHRLLSNNFNDFHARYNSVRLYWERTSLGATRQHSERLPPANYIATHGLLPKSCARQSSPLKLPVLHRKCRHQFWPPQPEPKYLVLLRDLTWTFEQQWSVSCVQQRAAYLSPKHGSTSQTKVLASYSRRS